MAVQLTDSNFKETVLEKTMLHWLTFGLNGVALAG